MKMVLITILTIAASISCFGQKIDWDNKLKLPDTIGVAGAFAGVVDDYLIVAGGANFPNGAPWNKGTKTWHSTIYYTNINSKDSKWQVSSVNLPSPIAYGVSIQTKDGLICIGGCDATKCYHQLLLITINNGKIAIKKDLPSLPKPLANATGSIIDNKIYIAGGNQTMTEERATSHFFMLDLSKLNDGWSELTPWDGAARGYAVSAAQNGKFYLLSGRNYSKERGIEILTDGHVFDPQKSAWSKLKGRFPVMAGSSISLEKDKIALLGGTDTIIAGSDSHPGFGNTIRIYNTSTSEINSFEAPYKIAVTTAIARHGNTFFICSGEIKPGLRTPIILKATITTPENR